MTKQQRRLAELKVVRVLKYWQDADIFSLDVKKRIAEIKDTEITISIFTGANRTVYREER